MTIQTENLILASHLPRYLRAWLRGPQEFENIAGLRVADGIREEFSALHRTLSRISRMRANPIHGSSVSASFTETKIF